MIRIHHPRRPARRASALLATLSAATLALALAGCASSTRGTARRHLIAVDAHGFPLDPDNLGERLCDKDYARLLTETMEAIEAARAPKGILLFVHGGLNSIEGARQRLLERRRAIVREGYYPIFIAWESGLVSSYVEHLFQMKRGERWLVFGPILSPFQLIADLGRAVVRAPLTWWNNLASGLNSTSIKTPNYRDARTFYSHLYHDFRHHPGARGVLRVRTPDDTIETLPGWGRAITHTITLPVKFVLAPLIDAAGSASWSNMLRRTHTMFDREDQIDIRAVRDCSRCVQHRMAPGARGAVAVFMERLAQTAAPDRDRVRFLQAAPSRIGWADELLGICRRALREDEEAPRPPQKFVITLIGHSAGTIVLNEVIRRFDHLEFRDIVYLGAACSIRDWRASVIPYLEMHPNSTHYTLMLHPDNEVRERNPEVIPLLDIAPRGSLLVWIDDFFAYPDYTVDRTLGRWQNIMRTTHMIPREVRDRIHLRTFGIDDGGWGRFVGFGGSPGDNPQRHGDFTIIDFWDKSLWTVPDPGALAADESRDLGASRLPARL